MVKIEVNLDTLSFEAINIKLYPCRGWLSKYVKEVNYLGKDYSETAEELGLQSKAIPSIRFKAWGRIRRRTKKANITDDEEYQL